MRRSNSQASLSTIADVLYQRNKPEVIHMNMEDRVNGRTRPEGKQFQERNRAGVGVAALFAQMGHVPLVQPAKPPVKKPDKDYVSVNKLDIQKLEQEIKEAKQKLDEKRAEKESQQPFVMKKFQDVPSRYNQLSSLSRTKSAHNISSTNNVSIGNGPMATLPSAMDAPRPLQSSTLSKRRQSDAVDAPQKDFLKLNIRSVEGRPGSAKRAPYAVEADRRDQLFQRTHKVGKLPKYLVDRKMSIGNDKSRVPAQDPDCPPGHVLLSNEERKNTLQMLQKAHDEVVNKLNSMPLRCDTLRLVRLHRDYMQQLEEIEEAQRIFSKPKVFVLNDSNAA